MAHVQVWTALGRGGSCGSTSAMPWCTISSYVQACGGGIFFWLAEAMSTQTFTTPMSTTLLRFCARVELLWALLFVCIASVLPHLRLRCLRGMGDLNKPLLHCTIQVRRASLFPLSGLMLHGIVLGVWCANMLYVNTL